MANTTNDIAMSTLLSEIRASNTKYTEHAAAFQQLTSRLDKLSVTSMDSRSNSTMEKGRSASPRHVRFEERGRSPSPTQSRYEDQQFRRSFTPPRPPTGYDRPRPPAGYDRRRTPSTFRRTPQSNIPYYRCGRSHPYRACPAQNATCMNCQRIGHYSNVCR